ncbi:Rhamnosyltransferase 1 subunit A [compost metagenome]
MHFHINQVLDHDLDNALRSARVIDIPVLFINGEWDEYTTSDDARQFSQHVRNSHFSEIRATGHFLDMEHKAASNATRDALLGFLKPAVRESRIRNQHVQEHHALAI